MASKKVNASKSVLAIDYAAYDAAIEKYFRDKEDKKTIEAAKRMEEEWIWVSGYKGTDANMKCRDYQYELGKKFDMPDGEVIIECQNGFHLCRDLDDVFRYYSIGNGNRFFEVQALVRKTDYENYGTTKVSWYGRREKLVAKSIIFTKELTADQILAGHGVADWTDEEKAMALKESVSAEKDLSMDMKILAIMRMG